jgi:chromosome segregation ATPase
MIMLRKFAPALVAVSLFVFPATSWGNGGEMLTKPAPRKSAPGGDKKNQCYVIISNYNEAKDRLRSLVAERKKADTDLKRAESSVEKIEIKIDGLNQQKENYLKLLDTLRKARKADEREGRTSAAQANLKKEADIAAKIAKVREQIRAQEAALKAAKTKARTAKTNAWGKEEAQKQGERSLQRHKLQKDKSCG